MDAIAYGRDRTKLTHHITVILSVQKVYLRNYTNTANIRVYLKKLTISNKGRGDHPIDQREMPRINLRYQAQQGQMSWSTAILVIGTLLLSTGNCKRAGAGFHYLKYAFRKRLFHKISKWNEWKNPNNSAGEL